MAAPSADLQAKIEAYLLGRLPHGERTRIERLVFEDDDVLEAVRDTEDELIDRYLEGDLAAADREAFERKFAVSTSRQERIALARALSEGVVSGGAVRPAAAAVVVDSAFGHRASAPFARRPVLAAAASIAAVLVIGLAVRSGRSTREDPSVSRSPRMGTASPSTPVPAVASAAPSVVLPPAIGPETYATLVLPRVGLRRGEGSLPRLRVPAATTAIRLQPELDAPARGVVYTATVRRVEGPLVWEGTVGAHDRGRLTVTVPTRLVGAGDYVLRLSAPGTSPDDSAEYPFRISAQD